MVGRGDTTESQEKRWRKSKKQRHGPHGEVGIKLREKREEKWDYRRKKYNNRLSLWYLDFLCEGEGGGEEEDGV